ncbi:TIGR01841 family phasin [Rhodoferax sp.]|uniref:TIGR01841 family phasin n=1 Tax=Rhodoferax sp. TaxID=50421 RepID=UPI00374DA827
MLNFDTITATQKSAVTGFFDLSNALFDGMQSLTQLNLQAAKATLQEAADSSLAATSLKDPKELIALQTRVLKAAPEKAASYLRHVQSIATTSSTEVRQYLEDVSADAKTGFNSLVASATQNAPAGTEQAVALLQSALTNATGAIETAQKAAKQATDKAVQAISAHLEAKA